MTVLSLELLALSPPRYNQAVTSCRSASNYLGRRHQLRLTFKRITPEITPTQSSTSSLTFVLAGRTCLCFLACVEVSSSKYSGLPAWDYRGHNSPSPLRSTCLHLSCLCKTRLLAALGIEPGSICKLNITDVNYNH